MTEPHVDDNSQKRVGPSSHVLKAKDKLDEGVRETDMLDEESIERTPAFQKETEELEKRLFAKIKIEKKTDEKVRSEEKPSEKKKSSPDLKRRSSAKVSKEKISELIKLIKYGPTKAKAKKGKSNKAGQKSKLRRTFSESNTRL